MTAKLALQKAWLRFCSLCFNKLKKMEEQNNPLDQEEFNSDDLQDNLDESLAYANDEESGEESSEIARLKAEVAELKSEAVR